MTVKLSPKFANLRISNNTILYRAVLSRIWCKLLTVIPIAVIQGHANYKSNKNTVRTIRQHHYAPPPIYCSYLIARPDFLSHLPLMPRPLHYYRFTQSLLISNYSAALQPSNNLQYCLSDSLHIWLTFAALRVLPRSSFAPLLTISTLDR